MNLSVHTADDLYQVVKIAAVQHRLGIVLAVDRQQDALPHQDELSLNVIHNICRLVTFGRLLR